MTTPGGEGNDDWAGNNWLPTANKPGGSGLGAFGNRSKDDWGNGILGIFGDTAPKGQAITEGLFTNWLGQDGNPDDPLVQDASGRDKNLILNGGFEASTGWTFPTGGSRDATVGRTALGSAKIVCNGTVQALTSASVNVVEGQLLLFGGYAKWTSIAGAVEASLLVQFYSGATLLLEQELAAFTPAGSGGWQELQQAFTAPTASTRCVVVCEIQATSGTLWWDDVSVRKKITDKVDEATTTADGAASTASSANGKANNIIDLLIGAASGGSVGSNPLVDAWNSVLSLFGLADTAHSNGAAMKLGILNGWGSGSSSGADSDVFGVMAQIKAAIASGATVTEYTSSATWAKPSGLTEFYTILVGSGETGGTGNGVTAGGTGGRGGGFLAFMIDPDDLPSTVDITIGTGGGTTQFGSLAESALDGNGLAGLLGFTSTTSAPGRGGNGGKGRVTSSGSATAGTAGSPSALGAGGTLGAAGANVIGSNGGDGGDAANVSTSTTTKSGAGGGGGGGGAGGSAIGGGNGGAGGDGGFPGGGGGGGGGRSDGVGGSNGAGGNGGNGICWTIHKAAV